MQHVTLLCVGSIKESWAKEACAFYFERLERVAKFDVVELPASKEKDPEKQQRDESARLIDSANKIGGALFVLDEKGKGMTSDDFSKLVGVAKDQGMHLVFLLGGAYGLVDDVKHAGKRIKLSDMTLPHELCRVVFFEQFYRATEILKGSGYHHA
jgi:23S rRNA (pseudouridine1915-N3)-methyltransferase